LCLIYSAGDVLICTNKSDDVDSLLGQQQQQWSHDFDLQGESHFSVVFQLFFS